jgi:transcriptional regulator with XRE-family HTH domain
MKNINSILGERFKNKSFEKEYHRTATFFRLANELLLLRKKRGITQRQLAEKVGTVQAVVSRLENASVKASLETIVKLAEALDAVVEVRLIPLEEVKKDIEDPSEDISQLQHDAEKGIVLFHADQTKKENSKWVNAEAFSTILSLSNKPSLAPISSKAKVRKYA